jgi:hypothetical protein
MMMVVQGQSDNNASRPAYETMAKTFRQDPTRLVTWADNRGEVSEKSDIYRALLPATDSL